MDRPADTLGLDPLLGFGARQRQGAPWCGWEEEMGIGAPWLTGDTLSIVQIAGKL